MKVLNYLVKSFTIKVALVKTIILTLIATYPDLVKELLISFGISTNKVDMYIKLLTAIVAISGFSGVVKGRIDADIKPPIIKRR